MEKEIYYEINVTKVTKTTTPSEVSRLNVITLASEVSRLNITTLAEEQILHLRLVEEPNLVQLVQAACASSDVNYE